MATDTALLPQRRTLIKSFISVDKIKKSVVSFNNSIENTQKTTLKINQTLVQSNRQRQSTLVLSRSNFQKRREAVQRREREDIIEASGISGATKRQGKVISSSTKGFLGRILDFVGTLMVGWMVNNLPKIINLGGQLIERIRKLVGVLRSFVSNLNTSLSGFGGILTGSVTNFINFDFSDDSRLISNSFDKLKIGMNGMKKDFDDAVNILKQPLDFGFGDIKIDDSKPDEGGGGGGGGNYGSSGENAVKQYAARNGYSKEFTAGLLSTISAESGFDPYAIGDSGNSYGLFQFNHRAARRKPFLDFLEANGIPNPMGLYKDPKGPSAKKYRDKVFGLTLEYMMQKEQGAQLVRDYAKSNDIRTVMGGFEDIEGYEGNQSGNPRNKRNNTKYNNRLKSAQAYLKSGVSPAPGSAKPSPIQGTTYRKGDVLTNLIGKGVSRIEISSPYKDPKRPEHLGLDIACPSGTYIALRYDCEVIFTGWENPNDHKKGYGQVMDVWVPELGVQLRMGHLSSFLIRSGKIKAGTSFARVGSTGNASGPHIHFEYDTVKGRGDYGGSGNPGPYVTALLLTSTLNQGSFSKPSSTVQIASIASAKLNPSTKGAPYAPPPPPPILVPIIMPEQQVAKATPSPGGGGSNGFSGSSSNGKSELFNQNLYNTIDIG